MDGSILIICLLLHNNSSFTHTNNSISTHTTPYLFYFYSFWQFLEILVDAAIYNVNRKRVPVTYSKKSRIKEEIVNGSFFKKIHHSLFALWSFHELICKCQLLTPPCTIISLVLDSISATKLRKGSLTPSLIPSYQMWARL